jgi:hypothetical protein
MWIGLGRLRTQDSPVAVSSSVRGPGGRFKFFARTVAVREKHIKLVNAQRCVCACVCAYTLTWSSRDSTVQTAIMFSVTNSRYFKRNCEFNEMFFESRPDRV